MENQNDLQSSMILKNLRKIHRDIRDLDQRLSRMETDLQTVGWLKVYMEFLPGLTTEKLLPFLEGRNSVNNQVGIPAPVYEKYKITRQENWSWKEHILFTLFHEDRPLQTVELVQIHLNLKVKGKLDERLVRKDVGKNLTDLVKDGRVVKYKPQGHTKFYYCLPKWMDEGGELKGEYWGKSPFL